MLLRTDILQKTVVRCPCLSSMTVFLGTICLPSQEGRRFFTFKRIRMSTYYFNSTTTTTTTSHFLYGCPGAFLYSNLPPNNQKMFTRHLLFKFFLFVLMTLIASIITFYKKKILEKKKCYSRPSTWYPRPRHGTLDPRPSTKR